MNLIDVDSDAIRIQIEQLRSCLTETRSIVSALTITIESLQSMWTGEAHDEFVAHCTADRQKMEDMCEVLENIIDSMTLARNQYDNCEDDVEDIVFSLRLPEG